MQRYGKGEITEGYFRPFASQPLAKLTDYANRLDRRPYKS
jgi:hypothetical protein